MFNCVHETPIILRCNESGHDKQLPSSFTERYLAQVNRKQLVEFLTRHKLEN